ncbi:MAG: hypothetical protein GY716_13100, partial [bacterium]|nr:hypothetical protein [bacterium]
AWIRCDQLVFFTQAPQQGVRRFSSGQDALQRAQATMSRVYYGHGFQLGDRGEPVQSPGSTPRAIDVAPTQDVFPWTAAITDGSIDMVKTNFEGAGIFGYQGVDPIDLPQTDARRWIFTRQPIVLLDDDFEAPGHPDKTNFMNEVLTAKSFFFEDPRIGMSPQIRDGRLDAAATQFDDLRLNLLFAPDGMPRPWRQVASVSSFPDQMTLIGDELLYYPRVERFAPSSNRIDQALTNHAIVTGCSSFRVDWTWVDGTGSVPGNVCYSRGVNMDPEQEWFGLPDPDNLDQRDPETGVWSYGQYYDNLPPTHFQIGCPAPTQDRLTISPENIERADTGIGGGSGSPIKVYEAIFGWNRSRPLDDFGNPDPDMFFTPWPTALRITMTIHDPAISLEAGREVQFIIALPRVQAGIESR